MPADTTNKIRGWQNAQHLLGSERSCAAALLVLYLPVESEPLVSLLLSGLCVLLRRPLLLGVPIDAARVLSGVPSRRAGLPLSHLEPEGSSETRPLH